MNKRCKILECLIIMVLLLFIVFQNPIYADAGDFDSYDSGWDSSSSWDSGSSSSSSDYSLDDDWDDSSTGNGHGTSISETGVKFLFVMFLFVFIIGIKSNPEAFKEFAVTALKMFGVFAIFGCILIIASLINEGLVIILFFVFMGIIYFLSFGQYSNGPISRFILNKLNRDRTDIVYTTPYSYLRDYPYCKLPPKASQEEIESVIKENDINFNKDEFLAWAKEVFIKLQSAWSNRNCEEIIYFETLPLYEQHKTQIQRYIDNGQRNIIQGICINLLEFLSFEEKDDREYLHVLINSEMTDYIIDENTGKILQGDMDTRRVTTYEMTFVRKKGVKTVPGMQTIKEIECPNCGALTKITSFGKCTYCGSGINSEDFTWILANLEPYKPK